MIHEAPGRQAISQPGTIIPMEPTLSQRHQGELLAALQRDAIGQYQRSVSKNLIKTIEFGGERNRIRFHNSKDS
jgi:hypothetical protein